ncbi:hypothetical protein DEU56DRAFT_824592 [Suillus clintonianus]|uniref:uncharacterized protein n=1 Tax=Suillus clintonianus TaxID=1904413 RepID=UPI001B862030|nr:uncharacterized protein DEU56DRAFT_824592 [Suillus clintonianus]KAG2125693.1 hypothetical protein DEU56DRAFT_824592 [Suillus clintonianus]
MYLGTLATNVSPGAKAWQFDIPRSLVHDTSNFTLRYITNTPYDMIIYSADFTIVVKGGSFPTSASSLAVTSSSTSENLFFQATSAASPSAPSSSESGSETPMPSARNIVMPPLRPGDVSNVNQPSGNSRNSGGRIDIEKLKFRVVFILWPALLGVTMAL